MTTDEQPVAVRILVAVAAADFSWQPGQVVSLPRALAAAWADGDRAEYVEEAAVEQPAPPPPTDRRTRGGSKVETTESASRPARTGRRGVSTVETT